MGAVERGEKNITLAMINKIARALNISLSELFKQV
jgi:transcriptional regulator with XRE-family HTH domain